MSLSKAQFDLLVDDQAVHAADLLLGAASRIATLSSETPIPSMGQVARALTELLVSHREFEAEVRRFLLE